MNFIPKKIIGLDFHDYSAELVELKLYRGVVSLEAYNRITFPPSIIVNGDILKEDEFKNGVKTLLSNANPKPITNQEVCVVFPSAKIFTHIFSFPINLSYEEIKKALPYEIEKTIPFSLQDIYWDFSILEEEDAGKKHASKYVLFGGITKQTADKYSALLQSIGLTPVVFGIDPDCLKYGLIKQINPLRTTLVIDINTLGVNYLVIKNNVIKKFSTTSKGGRHLIASLHQESHLAENVLLDQKETGNIDPKLIPLTTVFLEKTYHTGTKIIEEYLAENKNDQINDILLTGEFLNLPNFLETAQKTFTAKNIIVGDPRCYLQINNKNFLEDSNPHIPYATYFINAVGIAMRGFAKDKNNINLLPDLLRQTFSGKKKIFILGITAILIAIISLTTAALIFFKHQDMSYERLRLEAQKSAVDKLLYGKRYQEIRSAIEKFNNEVGVLSNIEGTLFSSAALIEDIQSFFDDGLTLNGVNFSDTDLSLEITGISKTRENLLTLHQNLKKADFVSEIITPISNYDEKVNISFVLKLKLNFKNLKKYGTDI